MEADRRAFLKTAALSAASYERALGANERIRFALIGAGGRGQYLANLALQAGGTELVAVCDAYEPRRTQAREKFSPGAREYLEYREILERKDVDAVIVGSPDHWHVPMTIDAVRAGKDVYVEKPVSHTIEEGERLEKTVAGSKQIVQVGYQQRSWDHFQQARDLIAAGRLGKISLILVSWYQPYYRTAQKVPDIDASKLDWKRFLGSAPDQPFRPERFAWWRWYWDFGGGHLTDLYSHYGDVVHWAMRADSPSEAQSMGSSIACPRFECPDTISTCWRYPGFFVSYEGSLIGNLDGGNLIFRGSTSMMKLNRDGFAVYPEGGVAFEKTNYPEPEIQARSLKDGSPAHMANFLDCARSRKEPNAPVGLCVSAARAAQLGNLALRSKQGGSR
jgi:predicted dehydrogenase